MARWQLICLRGFVLQWLLQHVAAMMDIRQFAFPDPPPMPDFVDPGMAPPSFIFAPTQIRPPYDLTATDIPEPYPSCEANYASVCSVQHSIKLVTRTREEVCSELAAGGARRQAALDNITSGYFSIEDTTGYGVFALDSNGYFIADALRPDLVGQRFDGYLHAGMVADSTVLQYIDWLVKWGGGFLPHLSTRLAGEAVDVLARGAPERMTAYVEGCDSGDRLGVAFKRAPMPGVEDCNSKTNDFCAEQNVRRIVGLVLVDSLNTHSNPQLVQIFYDVSYGQTYSVGSYYIMEFLMGWLGYPGPNKWSNPGPLENTHGTCVGHGSSILAEIAGWNTSVWYNGVMTGPNDPGFHLQWVAHSTAWDGGGFVDYTWYTAELGWHYKVTFAVGFVWNSTAYIVGSGLVHIPQSAASGPLCATCTDESLPCAIQNTYRLAAHASAEYRKIGSDWGSISNSTWFGSMYEDADDNNGAYAGTWPWGTYVFAFSWEGICVADGKTKSNIGKAVDEILGSWETHERFKRAANSGGWLQYELPDGTTRIARVVKQAKDGSFYYLASSYKRSQAAIPADCSSAYAEPCGETTAQALLGHAASAMLASEDADTLQDVIDGITDRVGDFSEDVFGDFGAYVFDEDWSCASNVACPDIPDSWLDTLKEIGTTGDGGWTSLAAIADYEAARVFSFPLEWSSPISTATLKFHLSVFVTDAPGPPKCTDGTDCPSDTECDSGRCGCKYGFLDNFTLEESTCGELPPASLECVDVRNKLCVGLVCEDCPAGSYCPIGSELECTSGFVCPKGESPQACPKGKIANATNKLLTSLADCDECAAGSFNDAEGQTVCQDCSAGTAQNSTGSSSCMRCEVGYYQDSVGSRSCLKCPGVLTTLYSGAVGLADCICPEGTYELLESKECAACPEGMVCPDNSTEAAIPGIGKTSVWPHPEALAGYMVLQSDPVAAYKCKDASWCIGGPPGSCARGRDQYVIGCSKCENKKFTTQDGPCDDCDGASVYILVSGVSIGLLVALGVFAQVVNRNQLNQSNAMLVVVITLGLTVSAIQTLGIFASLSVSWTEPLRSMFKVLSLVSFDLKVLKAECVVGNQSVTNMIVRQLVAPASACYVAAIVFLRKRWLLHRGHVGVAATVDFASQVTNAVGAIFQIFFVAILLSALMPLICYKHPNGLGHSMVSDPSVLCNNEGEHLSLVMVSVAALLLVVLPFLAVIASATVGYRTRMGHSSASRHLQMFRFLFFRYHPNAYYYGVLTLLRGMLVCLVPVVLRDVPALQLLFMATILLVFCAFQLHLKPWRGSLPNFVDASSNILMVLLIVAVAMTTDFEDADSMLGIFSAMIFVGLFAGVSAVGFFNVYKFFRPKPYFAHFLCHHKAQAAAQARYLQILIVQRGRSSCFLDSDHLSNLEELFDIVRTRCGKLVVYLTTDTLRRPWCAGEISITYQTHRRAISIVHPTFCFPNLEELEVQNVASYLAAADFKLVEYGVTDDVVSRAYRWLLCDNAQKFDIPIDMAGRSRFESAVAWLLRKSFTSGAKQGNPQTPSSSNSSPNGPEASEAPRTSMPPLPMAACNPRTLPAGNLPSGSMLRPKSLLISSRSGDDEATAAAAVLMGKIQEACLDLVPAGLCLLADLHNPDEQEVYDALVSAHALIVILTEGSLHSTEQLQHVVDAFSEDVLCIPVNTPSFRFPGQDFFDSELPLRYGKQASEVDRKVRQLMKCIAVPFTTYGSQQVLDVQADAVVQRVPRQLASSLVSPVSSKTSSKRQLDLMQAEQSNTISRLSTGHSHTFTLSHSENSSALLSRIYSNQSQCLPPTVPSSLAVQREEDDDSELYTEIIC